MGEPRRQLYVVSDTHFGGAYAPAGADAHDRGFRINTQAQQFVDFVDALAAKSQPVELVVNGDLVDFLAQRTSDEDEWSAFRADEAAATRTFEVIAKTDASVFEAFRRLLAKGHRLTILLGNHDIELALPRVRKTLAQHVGATAGADYHFVFDGEAYVVGDALIEHGNRYDWFNVVDHDALRRVRSLLSRCQPVPGRYEFQPPAGSRMVATVINPIKDQFRFVDLLKPESSAVVPLLLALAPGFRRELSAVAAIAYGARKHRLEAAGLPSFSGDIRSSTATTADEGDSGLQPAIEPLDMLLNEELKSEAGLLRSPAGAAASDGDIFSGATARRGTAFLRLLLARDRSTLDERIPALLATLRHLQSDNTFAREAECYREYESAARELASTGKFSTVVFGHTHLARDIAIGGGARYLNSGTWADLIQFPCAIVSGPERQAVEALRAFAEDLQASRLAGWTLFKPTYVRLDVAGDRVVSASLCDYVRGAQL
jgi:UDP-2,3-diacylglucosamine pyrophosphatase LpxH